MKLTAMEKFLLGMFAAMYLLLAFAVVRFAVKVILL